LHSEPGARRFKQGLEEAFLSAVGDELPEEQRHVMVMYYMEDLTIRKISKITGKRAREIEELLEEIRKVIEEGLENLKESLKKKKKK